MECISSLRDFIASSMDACSAMQYLGWVGQFVESLMIKIQNIGVGDGEVKKKDFQQHPQGLLESQKTSTSSPSRSRSSSLLVLQGSLLFPDVPTSMFNFNLLFRRETITNIGWRQLSDTWVVFLAGFPACGAIIVRIERKAAFR